MKKPYLFLLLCLLVSAAMCISVSWRYQRGEESTISTKPVLPTLPTHSSDEMPPEDGCVRLYLCGREDSALMEQLVLEFTQATGIPCQIITGELEALMESDAPPTVFCVHSQAEAEMWQSSMLPLTDETLLDQLYSYDFAWCADGQPLALAMDMEAYGLIYNARLLAQAGFSRVDINNYAALRAYAGHITNNYSEMGFYSFCAPELQDRDLLEQILSLSSDADQIRGFLDLYVENRTATGSALTLFTEERFVFYLGSTGNYDQFSTLGINNLDILPAYTPDGGSIHCVCTTYWAIRANCGAETRQMAETFLHWMITPQEGTTQAPVTRLGWFAPFRDISGGNPLENKLRDYLKEEPLTVHTQQTMDLSKSRLLRLVSCLQNYMDDPTDENWEIVLSAIPQ